MARVDLGSIEMASMAGAKPNADDFFELGMMYSIGAEVETDLVAAHKWFNLAAVGGNEDAAYYRQQVAREMTDGDVAAAQRAAREWVTTQ